MLTIKIVSEYGCHNEVVSEKYERVQLFEAREVNTHQKLNETLVTWDDCHSTVVVPAFFGCNDWEKPNARVITAVYVENEKGKTVHAVKSLMK